MNEKILPKSDRDDGLFWQRSYNRSSTKTSSRKEVQDEQLGTISFQNQKFVNNIKPVFTNVFFRGQKKKE